MDHIKKAREILTSVRYTSMATVNADGSPHNSPLVFLYDSNFEYIYWGSHPEAQHSQNILRTGQAYFVVFNGVEGSQGVYIQASGGKMVEGDELVKALEVHNRFRSKVGKATIGIDYYQGKSPQRMWQAKVEKVWVNAYERNSEGHLVKDYKIEINRDELQSLFSTN